MHEILSLWDPRGGVARPDLHLPGSPERCVKRAAVEDADGCVWMIERLFPKQPARRQRIGGLLAHLAARGLPVPAFRELPGGSFIAESRGYHWQLSPFVPGDPLPQPDYVDDPERGLSLGSFLADLGSGVEDYPPFRPEPDFSLDGYTADLLDALRPRDPMLHEALRKLRTAIRPLLDAWNDLPAALCHGDFHPLNVIWDTSRVAAVVDWEFCGLRPRLYDLANCLGCVGIEDPDALGNGLAPALLRTLRDRDALPRENMALFPELLIGLRFAWMSEWLRRDDTEMQRLELRYMKLLADNRDGLAKLFDRILSTSDGGVSPR